MGGEWIMAASGIDQERAQAFAGRMMEVLDASMVQRMVSVGDETGLFETMAGLPPSTSVEIAAAAGLKERYVREWLAVMATARIVDYERTAKTFVLPPEHAAALSGQIGAFASYISQVGLTEEQIAGHFRDGGGVSYDQQPGLTDFITGRMMRPRMEESLISEVLPVVPGLPERLAAGIDVADVGSGLGYHVNLMAKAYPESRFTGYEFRPEALAAARAEAEQLAITNARFEARDVATLEASAAFDLVTTFDVIHDLAHPARVLSGIHNVLRPGGVLLMVDVAASSELADNLDRPAPSVFYAIGLMRCMSLSLSQGGTGLGPMWGEQLALEMLADAGFVNTKVERVDVDPGNNYYVAWRDPA
jgi:SAM-dependent methyltransferase